MMSLLLRTALVLVGMAAMRVAAQSPAAGPADDLSGFKVRQIAPKPVVSPFPMHGKTGRRQALDFRSPEQMTAADRELAEANEAEIARRAGLQGFDLGRERPGEGSWGYEQAVCPVFPEHLILEYSRGNGEGDVTLFAAVIPRGEGHVRVIPVRRRGYSLWTPVSSNALTINDFNHMVVEGQEGLSPDWLTLGLCYAALAGGHVRASLAAQTAAEEAYPLIAPATLTLAGKGGAEVHFADATPKTRAMEWVLSFAPNGRLLKVKHVATTLLVEKTVPGAAVEVGKPQGR
jgi:hypothetical protein